MTTSQSVSLKEHVTTVVALEVGKVQQNVDLRVGELDRKVDRIDAQLEKILTLVQSQRNDMHSEIKDVEARIEKRFVAIERAIVPLQIFKVKYGLIGGTVGIVAISVITEIVKHVLFG